MAEVRVRGVGWKDETQLQIALPSRKFNKLSRMSTPPRFHCSQPGCDKTYSTINSLRTHLSVYHRHRPGKKMRRPQSPYMPLPSFMSVTLSELTKRAGSVCSALVDWSECNGATDMNRIVASIVEQVKRIARQFRVTQSGICIGKSCVVASSDMIDPGDPSTWGVAGFQTRAYNYGNFLLCALVCIDDTRVPVAQREMHVDRHVWACAWERAVKNACEADPDLRPLMDSAKSDAGGGSISGSLSYPVIYAAIPRNLINGVPEITVSEGPGLTLDMAPKPPSARRNGAVLHVLRHAK